MAYRSWGANLMDLGHGHLAVFTTNQAGATIGLIDIHHKPDGAPCEGSIGWTEREPESRRWTLISLDPLEVSPSLLCKLCGDHGFIRGGRWIPA